MTTGTTHYVITPDPPHTLLVDGDQFVLIPDANCEHHARLEVRNCTGNYPIVRWLDKTDSFVAVGDDFLVEHVPTALVWNAAMASFVVAAQAVNIHGVEWLTVNGSTTVGDGTARLVFSGHGLGTVNCDITIARQFSALSVHNADKGRVQIRTASIGSTTRIYRAGVILVDDIVLEAGETAHFIANELNVYTMQLVSTLALPPGSGGSVTVHADLLGLLADDHPQYLTEARAIWQKNGTDIYNSNTGNVGIGTDSPTSLLHLKPDAVDVTLTLEGWFGTSLIRHNAGYLEFETGADYIFRADGTWQMAITGSGVAIGSIATPSYMLEVTGDSNLIGGVYRIDGVDIATLFAPISHVEDGSIHGKYYEQITEPVGAVDGSFWYDPSDNVVSGLDNVINGSDNVVSI